MKSIYYMISVLFSVFLLGCSGGGGGDDTPPPAAAVLTAIQISGVETSYIAGTQGSVTVTGSFDNGQSSTLSGITWSSDNTAVASISTNGLITAISEGTATLTATAQGFTANADITIVAPSLTSIDITADETSIPLGLTLQLSARGTFDNTLTETLNDVTWSSSDLSILTVSSEGLVTSIGVGTATITALNDGISATFSLEISSAVLQSINIQLPSANVALGNTVQAQALGAFSDGTSQTTTLAWTSSDESVATVDDQGLITSLATGTTLISGSLGDITADSASIMVTSAIAQSIEAPANATIAVGLQQDFNATLLFSDSSNQTATDAVWVSSNNSVVSVTTLNGTATISALMLGTAELTVTSNGFSDTFQVTVSEAVVIGLAFDVTEVSLPLGSSLNLAVIATLSDTSTMNVTSSTAFSVQDDELGTFAAPTTTEVTFTAGAQGSGTITATRGGLSTSVPLEVSNAVPESLNASTSVVSVAAGFSADVSVTVIYSDGTVVAPLAGVSWTIADTAIASVQTTGSGDATVTGIAEGSTTLDVAFEGLTPLTLDVEITSAQPTGLTFTIPDLHVGDEGVQLTPTVTFSDGTTTNPTAQVTWSSSDMAVATISNASGTEGIITPVSEGSTTITATFNGGTITQTVNTTVLQSRILTGFEIFEFNSTTNTSITIGEGDFQIELVFAGADADENVSLSSGSNLIASSTASAIEDISDVSALSFSASSVTLMENTSQSIASVQGPNDITALIQVHQVKNFAEGNRGNSVIFSWAVRTDANTSYSQYSVEDELVLFECNTPSAQALQAGVSGSCDERVFSLNVDTSATETFISPAPVNFPLRTHVVLVAIGTNYTVTDVTAQDTANVITPSFDGLVDDQVISAGQSAEIFLLVQPTGGVPATPNYSFNINGNAAMRVNVMATFTSNTM